MNQDKPMKQMIQMMPGKPKTQIKSTKLKSGGSNETHEIFEAFKSNDTYESNVINETNEKDKTDKPNGSKRQTKFNNESNKTK